MLTLLRPIQVLFTEFRGKSYKTQLTKIRELFGVEALQAVTIATRISATHMNCGFSRSSSMHTHNLVVIICVHRSYNDTNIIFFCFPSLFSINIRITSN